MNKNDYISHSDRDFWQSRRVLLTGHTGFKGSWLALWLNQLGAEVTGLALAPENELNLFDNLQLDRILDHRICDLRDSDALKAVVTETQPQIVFHLAAQPLVRRSYVDPVSTWETNVFGTINLLEALRQLSGPCTAVMITTDKVYRNNEWFTGTGRMTPWVATIPTAVVRLLQSWQLLPGAAVFAANNHTRLLTSESQAPGLAMSGGGDWAADRIVPDAMRALAEGKPIGVRNPNATRPWQHVLEPLGGYLKLAKQLTSTADVGVLASTFNFGPQLEANRSVLELVEESLRHWPGKWEDQSDPTSPHEANLLNLVIDKAHHQLGWEPRWSFATTVKRTVNWYRRVQENQASALESCLEDLAAYLTSSK